MEPTDLHGPMRRVGRGGGVNGRDGAPVRGFVIALFVRLALLTGLVIVLFRIVIPYLVDLQDNLALVAAAGLGVAGVAGLIWLAFGLTASIRRFVRRSGA